MAFADITGAVRLYRNDVEVTRDRIPNMEGLRSLFRRGKNDLVYIEGSRTSDVLRYGKRRGRLPFTVTFTDRLNRIVSANQ